MLISLPHSRIVKKINLVAFSGLVFLLIVFLGGYAKADSPIEISSWSELSDIRNDLTADYILVNDLTASDADYSGIGDSWNPIGSSGSMFTGNLNGQGYSISGLIINSPASWSGWGGTGLFGYTSGASITNLNIDNFNTTLTSDFGGGYYGTITGYMIGGEIDNCSVSGSISTDDNYNQYIGGLVGYDESSAAISSSQSNVDINGSIDDYSVGGLVGYSCANIDNSNYTGTISISKGNYVGGLIGETCELEPQITNSSSESTINAGDSAYAVGGLVGYSYASIDSSNSTSTITTEDNSNSVGGLVGDSYNSITQSYAHSTINTGANSFGIGGLLGSNEDDTSNSYAVAEINTGSGNFNVGCLMGHNGASTVTNSYSDGYVQLPDTASFAVGGLIGLNEGTIKNSFTTCGVTGGDSDIGGFIGSSSGSQENNSWLNTGNNPDIPIGDNETAELTYEETDKTQFYNKNYPFYSSGDPIWDFTTPIWYEWSSSLPKFYSEPEEETSENNLTEEINNNLTVLPETGPNYLLADWLRQLIFSLWYLPANTSSK
jgi:hypothetical protein